jgi:hypothetical protein
MDKCLIIYGNLFCKKNIIYLVDWKIGLLLFTIQFNHNDKHQYNETNLFTALQPYSLTALQVFSLINRLFQTDKSFEHSRLKRCRFYS